MPDSIDVAGDSVSFDLNPEEPQLLVLVYPTDEVSGNQLLFDVARHNFSSFVVKDYDLEPMNFGRLGLLLVKGFANFDELVHYRSVMASGLELPKNVRPVMISVKNFDTLLQQGRTFEEYFRYVDQQAAEAPVNSGPGLVEEDYTVSIARDRPEEVVEEDEETEDREDREDREDTVPALPLPLVEVSDIVQPTVDSLVVGKPQIVPVVTTRPVSPTPAAPVSKPQKPVSKPAAPKKAVIPTYPAGSEGDDDLLEN